MLVYRLQDLMDRSVPCLTAWRVPLAGHVASQLRILKLWVTTPARVLNPGENYAQVVKGVKDVYHLPGPSYVYLTTFVMNIIAICRQIARVDVSRVDISLDDLGRQCHVLFTLDLNRESQRSAGQRGPLREW